MWHLKASHGRSDSRSQPSLPLTAVGVRLFFYCTFQPQGRGCRSAPVPPFSAIQLNVSNSFVLTANTSSSESISHFESKQWRESLSVPAHKISLIDFFQNAELFISTRTLVCAVRSNRVILLGLIFLCVCKPALSDKRQQQCSVFRVKVKHLIDTFNHFKEHSAKSACSRNRAASFQEILLLCGWCRAARTERVVFNR